jgi:septum formation protein
VLPPPKLILASKSPRRQEILRAAGFLISVRAADVEEIRCKDETPAQYVRRLAVAKAFAVEAGPAELVLAADTVVVAGWEVLEKPVDKRDARRMLGLLSGRRHEVLTGVCLRAGKKKMVETAATKVWFAPLSKREIDAYVQSGEPMDKAGAYAIQGLASKYVTRVEGCYFNVVGLPVSLVYKLWKKMTVKSRLTRVGSGPYNENDVKEAQ